MRAVLHHIANQPQLRIDSSLFVDAGFDPHTWNTRKGPNRMVSIAAAASVAIMLGASAYTMQWSATAVGLSMLAIFVICVMITFGVWHHAYADTEGIFVFENSPPQRATGAVHEDLSAHQPGRRCADDGGVAGPLRL